MKVKIGKFLITYAIFVGLCTQYMHADIKLRVVDSDNHRLKRVTAGVPFKVIAEIPDVDHEYNPVFQTIGSCVLLDQNVRTKISTHMGYQKITQNYIFTLRCDEVGTITVGPIVFQSTSESFTSEVVKFDVDPPQQKSLNNKSAVFLQAITEKDYFYVGEKITIHLSFFSRNPFAREFEISLRHKLPGSLELLGNDGPRINKQKIDGTEYVVRTWRMYLKADSTGNIALPVFRGTYVEMMSNWFLMSVPEARSIYSQPLLLDIRSLPPHDKLVDSVGTVSSFTASIDKNSLEVGQALALKYTLTGRADFNAAHLCIVLPEEIKHFAAPRKIQQTNGEEIAEFEYVLQPKKEGEFIIPAQEFFYFDTAKEQFITLSTDPLLVVVSSNSQKNDAQGLNNNHDEKDKIEKSKARSTLPVKRTQWPQLPSWIIYLLMVASFCWANWSRFRGYIIQHIFIPYKKRKAFDHAREALKRATLEQTPGTVYGIFLELLTRRLDAKVPDITEEFTDYIFINKGMERKNREKWQEFFKRAMAYSFAKHLKTDNQDEFFNQAQVWINELETII